MHQLSVWAGRAHCPRQLLSSNGVQWHKMPSLTSHAKCQRLIQLVNPLACMKRHSVVVRHLQQNQALRDGGMSANRRQANSSRPTQATVHKLIGTMRSSVRHSSFSERCTLTIPVNIAS